MPGTRKTKISISIDSEVLSQVDRYAQTSGVGNRSNVIELWLRAAVRDVAARELERDTIAYYESLTAAEREEDAEWAAVSAEHLRSTAALAPAARRFLHALAVHRPADSEREAHPER